MHLPRSDVLRLLALSVLVIALCFLVVLELGFPGSSARLQTREHTDTAAAPQDHLEASSRGLVDGVFVPDAPPIASTEGTVFFHRREQWYRNVSKRVAFLVFADKELNAWKEKLKWARYALPGQVFYIGQCHGCDYAVTLEASNLEWHKTKAVFVDASARFPARVEFFIKLDPVRCHCIYYVARQTHTCSFSRQCARRTFTSSQKTL